VGYVHLNQMDPENLARFQQAVAGFQAAKDVKGMILDVRENGGGNIHVQLMAILQARPFVRLEPRGQARITQPQLYWDKPIVLLVNERSFSDAEVFPWSFRAAGLGKTVGMPTPGGVIGTNDITLSDGSKFRIPRVGWYSLDGKNLEGHGFVPDYVVPESSEDRLAGRDPQLGKAIELILEQMQAPAATPAPTVPTPAVPHPAGSNPAGPHPGVPGPKSSTPPAPTPVAAEDVPSKDRPAGTTAPTPSPAPSPVPPPAAPSPEAPAPEAVPSPDAAPKPAAPQRPAAADETAEADEGAAAGLEIENPLADAAVGEWIRFRQVVKGVTGVVTLEVVEVSEHEVVLKSTLEESGTRLEGQTLKRPRTPKLAVGRGRAQVLRHASETIDVAGTSFPCTLVTLAGRRGGAAVSTWYSLDAPVTGVVKRTRGDEVVLELLAWGRTPPPAGR